MNNCTGVLLQWEAKVFYICTGQDSAVFTITEWWVILLEPATVRWGGIHLTHPELPEMMGWDYLMSCSLQMAMLHGFSLLLAAEGVDLGFRKDSASYSIYGRWEKLTWGVRERQSVFSKIWKKPANMLSCKVFFPITTILWFKLLQIKNVSGIPAPTRSYSSQS